MRTAIEKQQEAEKKSQEAQNAAIVKQKEAEALEAKVKQTSSSWKLWPCIAAMVQQMP
jgi:hypothetical protein